MVLSSAVWVRWLPVEPERCRDMNAKSSKRWLARQRRDYFASAARREGRHSRAHYKLQQLDERFKLLQKHDWVLELGAAPGGWTAYLAERVTSGRVIAVDPRPVAVGAGHVDVLQGSLGEPEIDQQIDRILAASGQHRRAGALDLVLSDMAPNISGIRATDQALAIDLAELASGAAIKWLRPGGNMVVKIYQGEGIEAWLRDARRRFGKVNVVKPPASRAGSRENYALARDFRGDR